MKVGKPNPLGNEFEVTHFEDDLNLSESKPSGDGFKVTHFEQDLNEEPMD